MNSWHLAHGYRYAGIHSGYLKSSITVMDLTATMKRTPLLDEAKARGCVIVEPRDLFLRQLQQQASVLTGKPVPPEVLSGVLPENEE